jgi:multidrug efflux pump subunit AcrA (membrane-fusion protein)
MLTGLCLATTLPSLPAAEAVVLKGLLSLDEEAQVPAQEPGVLKKILVRDGQQVAVGELLAQIDDIVPQAKRDVANFKFEVAKEQATNDVDLRYANKGADVAKIKYLKSLEAVRKTPKSVAEVDINEQRLDWEKFVLMAEKAAKDMTVAKWQMHVSEAELKAADAELKRHKITAPLDAVVMELTRHEGEWVLAGDTVMRLVRVDRLRVEGYLNIKDYQAKELRDRPVSVAVDFPRAPRETFRGKIVFVSPVVGAGGNFLVRAEVQNRQQDRVWVLSPGLPAEMTIQLK